MIDRRSWIRTAAGSGAALALSPTLLRALEALGPGAAALQGSLLKKAIPSTGEMLPVIGLGSSATFASVARSEEITALKEVFKAMVERGATLLDTAPSFGISEQVAGQIVNELGIDYAADNRQVDEVILPLAQERKIAVLAYAPFGRTSRFRRIGDRPLLDWAAKVDAKTWAQLLLKWVVSHPAITAVTPATSQARHMIDNIGGGVGRLPTPAQRKALVDFVDALPPAPPRTR